ncbi:hypothetical protein AAG570_003983 [Ranatra chinensis]|uniref:MYND-type domain-containing protein n=1 Tax=Ranatra chinensis TaxID=642074 RepID=A0ABD0Y2T3_9HEMI
MCSECESVWYCGPEHQADDWTAGHRAECRPLFKIEYSKVLSRYMVAIREIKAGQAVLRENAMILGPKMNSVPVCLGCHAALEPQAESEDYYRCRKCTWPLCSSKCEKSPRHSKECHLMASKKYNSSIKYDGVVKPDASYCVVTPLRCLLLEKSKYDELLTLESHVKIRSATDLYRVLKANLVPFIKDFLGLPYDEETILKVAGVLDTNCFAVRSFSSATIRGLYMRAAMLAHDCKPNTKHYFTEDMELVVLATVDIKKGTPITATYTQSLWGTEVRREHLLGAKCFQCSCQRCADPTELGTYLGALRCPKCKDGKVTSLKPLDTDSQWKCECGFKLTAEQVCRHHVDLQDQVKKLDKSKIETMEEFLQQQSKNPVVHDRIYEIVQVKHALLQLYAKKITELSPKQLQRYGNLLKELLDLANILEPGLTRLRGELLYDLHALRFLEVREKLTSGTIDKAKAQVFLKYYSSDM